MTWLKDKWPSLLAVVLAGIIIYNQLVPKSSTEEEKRMEVLRLDYDVMRAQRDSLAAIVEKPAIIPDTHVADSLQQVAVANNIKNIYEILKKNKAGLDTATSDEFRRRYAAIPR